MSARGVVRDHNVEVCRLQVAIARVTGRNPVSGDLEYLRRRLADLSRRISAGEDVHRVSDMAVVTSVSMSPEARAAVGRIMERKQCGMSELVRRALAEWAARNSFRDEAKLIDPQT